MRALGIIISGLAMMLLNIPVANAGAPPPDLFDPVTDDSFSEVVGVTEINVLLEQYASARDFGGPFLEQISSGMSGDISMDQVYIGGDENMIAYGQLENNGGHEMRAAIVDDDGNPICDVLIHDASAFYPFNKVIGMVAGSVESAFVLYAQGEDFTPTGNIELAHIDQFCSKTDLATYDYKLSDITTDEAGGAYIVTAVGEDLASGGGLTHGEIRHWTAGLTLDATFGTAGVLDMSSNTTSNKSGVALVSDIDSGGVVAWIDDRAGAEGIYAMRFDDSGTTLWEKQVYASSTLTGGQHLRMHADQLNGLMFYIAADDDGELVVIDFDENGDKVWACTQNLGANFQDYDIIGNGGAYGDPAGAYVLWEGTFAGDDALFAQLFDRDTGHSVWSIGGEVVESGDNLSGTDFNVVLQSQFYNTLDYGTRTNASSIGEYKDLWGTELTAYYSYDNGSRYNVDYEIIDPYSYPESFATDCVSPGSPPDAPTLSVDVIGNTEVDLSLIPGADNGSAHTDFVWEYKEASSGVWIPFPEGMNLNTALTITGLTNGVLYDFRAAGVNGIGQGPFSGVIQATPIGAGGRRRLIPNGGALFFFGSVPNAQLGEATGDAGSFIGRTSDPGLRGSAPEDNTPEVFQESTASPLAPENFSIQEYLSANLNTDKTNSILLLDLIVSLRWLMEWSDEENQYELLKRYESLGEQYERVFRTRWFHRLAGVEYLERIRKVNYNFDYRFPVQNETENVIFMMRSVLLTFGRSCIAPEVLAYAEEVDVPGQNYEYWYYRYLQIMKPWMDAVLGEKGYQVTRPTDDIDALEALFILLHQFCIGEGFATQVPETL